MSPLLAARAALLFSLCLSPVAGCAAAPPYAACGGEVGCAGGQCIELLFTRLDGTEGGGSFCSEACTSDADCMGLDGATAAACITLDRDPPIRFLCAARCNQPSDCFAGLACTMTDDVAVGSVCLP